MPSYTVDCAPSFFLIWSFSKGCTKLEHINISWCTQISSHGLKLLSQGCKNLLIFIAEGCCLVRKQTWFAINILYTSLLCVSLFRVFVTNGKFPLCVLLYCVVLENLPTAPLPPPTPHRKNWKFLGDEEGSDFNKCKSLTTIFTGGGQGFLEKIPSTGEAFLWFIPLQQKCFSTLHWEREFIWIGSWLEAMDYLLNPLPSSLLFFNNEW